METDHVSNDCSLAPLRPGRLPSQSRLDFPADSDERGRGGVLRSVILGMTVSVQSDLIVVIVTFVQSAGPMLTKQCIAQPTPLLADC